MEAQDYTPVSAPVTWFGSKSRLVKQIVKYFHAHQTFVDVFGGSGAILLGKRPSKIEVYNDLNRKMVSLFRVLRSPRKTQELVHLLELTPYAREEFGRCRGEINSVDNEIELARQMIVVQRQSHGGQGNQWSYCVDGHTAGYSASVRKFHAGIERLPEITKRIRKTQIENLPWQEVIARYDRNQTLFYLDPPYVPSTRINGKYEHEMSLEEHSAMVDVLLTLAGNAVLSGYAHDVYLPLEAAGWRRIEIEVVAQSSTTRATRTECLWVSPTRAIPKSDSLAPQDGFSGRQAAAYRTHRIRTEATEATILEAIKIAKRLGQRVSKAAIARDTGISRGQLSRRYGHLF